MSLRGVLIRVISPLAFILAGVGVGVVVDNPVGTGIAGFLIGVGCVIAMSIVFFEIGRSEERDRAREEEERRST